MVMVMIHIMMHVMSQKTAIHHMISQGTNLTRHEEQQSLVGSHMILNLTMSKADSFT